MRAEEFTLSLFLLSYGTDSSRHIFGINVVNQVLQIYLHLLVPIAFFNAVKMIVNRYESHIHELEEHFYEVARFI